MTARDAFQAMLNGHIGPYLRTAGFKTATPTWRLRSPRGDFAVVNFQKSRWDTGDQVSFYVNLAIVPTVWWEYVTRHRGKTPAAPTESNGMLRRRLQPPKEHPLLPERDWVVRDASSAANCGRVLIEQLDTVIPEMRAMMNPADLLAVVQAGARRWGLLPKPELAIAYVIADQGLTTYLREALDVFDATPQEPRLQQQSAWLRHRAARVHDGG